MTFFLEQQLPQIATYVRRHAELELINWPLSQKCTFEDVMTIISNIRMRVEGPNLQGNAAAAHGFETPELHKPLYSFLLPSEDTHDSPDNQLAYLLNETRDIIER